MIFKNNSYLTWSNKKVNFGSDPGSDPEFCVKSDPESDPESDPGLPVKSDPDPELPVPIKSDPDPKYVFSDPTN